MRSFSRLDKRASNVKVAYKFRRRWKKLKAKLRDLVKKPHPLRNA